MAKWHSQYNKSDQVWKKKKKARNYSQPLPSTLYSKPIVFLLKSQPFTTDTILSLFSHASSHFANSFLRLYSYFHLSLRASPTEVWYWCDWKLLQTSQNDVKIQMRIHSMTNSNLTERIRIKLKTLIPTPHQKYYLYHIFTNPGFSTQASLHDMAVAPHTIFVWISSFAFIKILTVARYQATNYQLIFPVQDYYTYWTFHC